MAQSTADAPEVSAITVREIRVYEAIESRRSIRRYTPERVSESQVEAVLEAARLAPSGSNTQPWRFIVIRSDSQREAVAKASHDQKWMMGLLSSSHASARFPHASRTTTARRSMNSAICRSSSR